MKSIDNSMRSVKGERAVTRLIITVSTFTSMINCKISKCTHHIHIHVAYFPETFHACEEAWDLDRQRPRLWLILQCVYLYSGRRKIKGSIG